MTVEISAFASVPPIAQGRVKDLRPRRALAVARLEDQVHLLPEGDADIPDYRRWLPFGQVATCCDHKVGQFESGVMLLRIAGRSDVLRPRGAQGAAQTQAWVFAALNSAEPGADNLILPGTFRAGEDRAAGFRPDAERLVNLRLKSLARWLDGRDWLTGLLGVADIVMATVLRRLQDEPVLANRPAVAACLERFLARPAFKATLAAQLATFAKNAPADGSAADVWPAAMRAQGPRRNLGCLPAIAAE